MFSGKVKMSYRLLIVLDTKQGECITAVRCTCSFLKNFIEGVGGVRSKYKNRTMFFI